MKKDRLVVGVVLATLLVGALVAESRGQEVTATVTWDASHVRVEVPAPYVIAFLQWSWVTDYSMECSEPVAVSPGWWTGAYNPDCNVCDDYNPDTRVRIQNGLWNTSVQRQSVVEFEWTWTGSGTVQWGSDLMCNGFFSNQPSHVLVYDTSADPDSTPLWRAFWYCDSVVNGDNSNSYGAFSWIVSPLVIASDTPSDVPVSAAPETWSAVRQLYR